MPGSAPRADSLLRDPQRDGYRGPRRQIGRAVGRRPAGDALRRSLPTHASISSSNWSGWARNRPTTCSARSRRANRAVWRGCFNALSIRHVGTRVAAVLAEHFGSIEAFEAASIDELSEVMEIGPVIAKSVHDFLHSDFGGQTIADLKQLGIDMTAPKKAAPAAESARSPARRSSSLARSRIQPRRDRGTDRPARRPGRVERLEENRLRHRRRRSREQAR